jgi:hypothetical protein
MAANAGRLGNILPASFEITFQDHPFRSNGFISKGGVN